MVSCYLQVSLLPDTWPLPTFTTKSLASLYFHISFLVLLNVFRFLQQSRVFILYFQSWYFLCLNGSEVNFTQLSFNHLSSLRLDVFLQVTFLDQYLYSSSPVRLGNLFIFSRNTPSEPNHNTCLLLFSCWHPTLLCQLCEKLSSIFFQH